MPMTPPLESALELDPHNKHTHSHIHIRTHLLNIYGLVGHGERKLLGAAPSLVMTSKIISILNIKIITKPGEVSSKRHRTTYVNYTYPR